MHLNARTSRELGAGITLAYRLDTPFGVELASNLVLVALYELNNHSPDHTKLFTLARGHWLAQIFELYFSFLQLLADLIHDLRKIVLNVSEQNSS